jgi:predicted flap endonuclease-1-like 5' DNA nuclease
MPAAKPAAKPAATPATAATLTADDDLVADAAPAAVDDLDAADELVAADELDTAADLDTADDLAAIDGQADDDLEVVEGIGPKIAGVLREAGINTFAQLAAADIAQLT